MRAMGKMSRVLQRKENNIVIPCSLLRKQTKVEQEQEAAPGWFQALLCTRRISIKHRKEKTITVSFPSKCTIVLDIIPIQTSLS